jgi:CRP-like cAMP-binding protein
MGKRRRSQLNPAKGNFLMSETTESDAPILNRLLAALPIDEYRRLSSKLKEIALNYGENIYKRGDIIRYVYFPTSGIVSLLAAVQDSATLEIGIVGREGIVGLALFLGVNTSNNSAIVQGAGFAMRMRAADFLIECRNGGALPQILRRFTHSMLSQVSQSAACYRFHPVEARLARWLLMTSDRMETHEFPVTQEFLSNMLGVRREAVNKSAGNLQQQELISYNRGNLSINDQTGLETAACLCYDVIRDEEKSFPCHK